MKVQHKFLAFSLLATLSLISCGKKMPAGSVESGIVVKAVPNISDDFIRGMDLSSLLVEEKSGVKFYDFDGKEVDAIKMFSDSGVNWVRLRVWNDPFDKDGNGYGGGNNDLATAIELGKRATKCGMKVLIDFHYSDFWADPKRQLSPKAWEGLGIDDKASALAAFTKESLDALFKAGVNVGMVQVGNEINNGLSGEKTVINVMKLLKAGTSAVRESAKANRKNVRVALHYTNIHHSDDIDRIGAILENFKIDYDVMGLSYYSFWNGSLENMENVLRSYREKYKKEVMIAETSYCYTAEDGDGFGNSVSGNGDIMEGYPATVQGQASMIRDVIAHANSAGAIGVFYWEGAWIPVGKDKAKNAAIWEKYGSGWASSYCSDYDPTDGALYYGGSSWDNQAFFDFDGKALESINVFKYLKYGSTAPLAVDAIPDVFVSSDVGTPLKMPEKMAVIYNDHDKNCSQSVVWDAEALSAVDTSTEGEYDIKGVCENTAVLAHVKVLFLNHAVNGSFEGDELSMWRISFKGDKNPTDFQRKTDDAHQGDVSLHFWSESDMDFAVEQTLTNLESGTYRLKAYAQGGDVKESAADFALFAKTSSEEREEHFMLSGWANWKESEISALHITDGKLTIGIRAKTNARSWGTFDDFVLNRIGD